MSWQDDCKRRGGTVAREPSGIFKGELACRLPSGKYELAPMSARTADRITRTGETIDKAMGVAVTPIAAVGEGARTVVKTGAKAAGAAIGTAAVIALIVGAVVIKDFIKDRR